MTGSPQASAGKVVEVTSGNSTTDAPFPMPPSVPPGMRLELSRARLLPGAQQETERWMGMLHERYEECLDTLSAERMAFEATFRHTDSDGTEWIYHLSLYGEGTAGLDLSNPVDQEHLAYAKRCKEPGWEELRPVLMLAPRPIRPALEAWGRDGELGDAPSTAEQVVGEHPEAVRSHSAKR